VSLEPHPYALLLPPLTAEEYAALKLNIERFGILHPVITDADGRVLDGVHRVRIAAELGLEPPLSQMGQLSEQAKLELAVGVNVRRRHLDAERRRELVRKLAEERGLTVRQIAEITGWSKSTVGRDLTPPADEPEPEELLERWAREHPEPQPEDFYSDEGDHVGRIRHCFAEIDHNRDRLDFLYRQAIGNAAELAATPLGAAFVLWAHAGLRFNAAERKAEAIGSTPEEFAEAQQAWVAFVAAQDGVAALEGKPFGADRPLQFDDFMYHPAFQGWRDEAEAVPDGTGAT
jgi:hypothetical protein